MRPVLYIVGKLREKGLVWTHKSWYHYKQERPDKFKEAMRHAKQI